MAKIIKEIDNILHATNGCILQRAGVASISYLLRTCYEQKKKAVVFAPTEFLHQILLYAPVLDKDYEEKYAIFPSLMEYVKDSALLQVKTLHALYMLSYTNPYITLVPYSQALCAFPSPSIFSGEIFEIHKGMHSKYSTMLERLQSLGYTTSQMVHRCGEMAYRGDIIDIYPPDVFCEVAKGVRESVPLRIEFFGDYIEDIRIFNKESQRFIKKIDTHTLYPLYFGCFSKEGQEEYRKTLGEEYRFAFTQIEEKGVNHLPSYLYQESTYSLFDWLPKDAQYYIVGDTPIQKQLEDMVIEIERYCNEQSEAYSIPIDAERCMHSQSIEKKLEGRRNVYVKSLLESEEGISLQEKTLRSFAEICPTKEAMEKPWKSLVTKIKEWNKEYHQSILVFKTKRNRDAFMELALKDTIEGSENYNPNTKGVFFCIGDLEYASVLPFASSIIIPESLLYPNYRAKKSSKKSFKGLQEYKNLQENTYVIHREYGIALYKGMHRIALGGSENDYLLLEYANEDKVYIPVHQIGVLQIYASEAVVALDSLGGSGWKNSIAKAKKAIEKIAHDLVEMYAKRKLIRKHRYGAYSELYREFEIAFGFEETPDQAKAIEDVLNDMDSAEPMDRLVCGDVGFGKTEVAIRACVRAGLDGRQAVLLCPTTILAEQHYQSIQNRIAMLPLRVALLNRFVSKQEQKNVLEGLAKGTIDIIVGTHRLLSADVVIPNLSLMVLDEEHRFGVRHKEKLKLMRTSIDTLTLTATPIPRTLQLSMAGVRELSVIETPPLERKAVQTFLCESGDERIQKAVIAEIERGGQVFWVYNRVHSIEERKNHIHRLCPTARIAIVHGQMNEKSLEESMRAFWEGEVDILLATTIIESGLDFPLANTIVIDSAHTFGLNQLYQLRGRVGRGDRQGYAFFVIPQTKVLSEIAMERLQAIVSLDYLGAGFHIAMEDMRIRGAGNILGEAQSGHIERIGVELYLEMLENEVQKLRSSKTGIIGDTPHSVEVSLSIPTFIPEEYIFDAKERLFYYRKLSMITDAQEEEGIRIELEDRFGSLPPQVDTFLALLAIKRIVARLGVNKAHLGEKAIVLYWKEGQQVLEPQQIISWALENKEYIVLHPPSSIEYKLYGKDVAQALRSACVHLEQLYTKIPA